MASPSPFDKLPSLGTAISAVVPPTLQLYIPLLQANEPAIRSTKRTTHSYGPHERHQLDVYHPSTPHTRNGRRPVLLFLYGGGLINGAKQIPGPAQGLAYTNLGHFFAAKFGFTVVVMDYRLLSHGAKFPSGGEDLSLAVDWICDNAPGPQGDEPIDLFIMGNSAGGIHTSQFLFHDAFASARARISSGAGTRLRGIVMLAVPFHFEQADPSRVDAVLTPFFGDFHANSPLGQIKALQQNGQSPDFIKGNGVRVLLLDAELDPEDEILVPRDDFMKQWLEFSDAEVRLALCADRIAKHNHISPPLGLGTGVHEQEQWGFQVAAFVHSGIAFPPSGV